MELVRLISLNGLLLLSLCVVLSSQASPTFSNLPITGSVSAPENSAIGYSVYTVTATDPDGGTVSYSITSSPSDGTTYFEITSSGEVRVKTDLDYETISPSTFTLTVMAFDDAAEKAAQTLVVDITDEPEGLVFDDTGYAVSAAEGQAAGTYLPDPGFTVTDGDNSDTFTCTMACPTASVGKFTMVKSTCLVYFTTAYSLDFGDTTPVVCVVTATDSTGNTATTDLTITITDVNNYTPEFTQSSYNFYVSYYDPIGTTIAPLGSIEALDYDIGSYGNIQYSLDQTNLPSPSNYFQIDSTTGVLRTIRELTSCNCPGTSLTFSVTATDDGGLSSTAPITVNVDTSTTTVTTTTARYKTFFDDPRSIAWFTACLLTALMTTIAGGFIIYKYCCNCRRNSYSNLRPDYEPNIQRFDDDDYRPRHKTNKTTRHTPIQSVRNPPPPIHEQKWRQTRDYP